MAKKPKKPIGVPAETPLESFKEVANQAANLEAMYRTSFAERMARIETKIYNMVAADKAKDEPSDPFAICMEVADSFGLHDPVDRGLPDWLTYIIEGEIHNTNPDQQPHDRLYRELTIAGDLLRRTPIVDNDFPAMAHKFDTLTAAAKKELSIK